MGEPYLIDRIETYIRVDPVLDLHENPHGIEVCHGGRKRRVRTDNVASYRKSVTFSSENRRTAPYRLHYSTKNGGAIRNPRPSGLNEADMGLLGEFHDHGTSYVYELTPEPGKEYALELEVLKGFDRGHRHIHGHFPRTARVLCWAFTLDLSGYANAGFAFSQTPVCSFHRDEPENHDVCSVRGLGRPVARSTTQGARWCWELLEVYGGVVDTFWDVVAPPGVIRLAAQ